jgi:hypothetical protein
MSNEKYLIGPIIILAIVSMSVAFYSIGVLDSTSINGGATFASTVPNPFSSIPLIGPWIDTIFLFLVQNFALSATFGLIGLLAIGILIGLVGVGLAIGAATVNGSINVNDSTTMIIYKSTMLGAIWALLSVLSSVAIFAIPYVGWGVYLIISAV